MCLLGDGGGVSPFAAAAQRDPLPSAGAWHELQPTRAYAARSSSTGVRHASWPAAGSRPGYKVQGPAMPLPGAASTHPVHKRSRSSPLCISAAATLRAPSSSSRPSSASGARPQPACPLPERDASAQPGTQLPASSARAPQRRSDSAYAVLEGLAAEARALLQGPAGRQQQGDRAALVAGAAVPSMPGPAASPQRAAGLLAAQAKPGVRLASASAAQAPPPAAAVDACGLQQAAVQQAAGQHAAGQQPAGQRQVAAISVPVSAAQGALQAAGGEQSLVLSGIPAWLYSGGVSAAGAPIHAFRAVDARYVLCMHGVSEGWRTARTNAQSSCTP